MYSNSGLSFGRRRYFRREPHFGYPSYGHYVPNQFPMIATQPLVVPIGAAGSYIPSIGIGGGGFGPYNNQLPVQVQQTVGLGQFGNNNGFGLQMAGPGSIQIQNWPPQQINGEVLAPAFPRTPINLWMEIPGVCRIGQRRVFPRFGLSSYTSCTGSPKSKKRKLEDRDPSSQSGKLVWYPKPKPAPTPIIRTKLFKSPKRLQTSYGLERHRWRLDQKRSLTEREQKRKSIRRQLELMCFKRPLKKECEFPGCPWKHYKRNRPFQTLDRTRKTPSRLSLLSVRSRSPITVSQNR